MRGREETTGVVRVCDQGTCTVADLDAVRYEVARADVLADATMHAFDLTIWREVAGVNYILPLATITSPHRPPIVACGW